MQPGSSTRTRMVVAVLAVLAVSLAIPAVSAARITVPPGSTEGDQYFEEVPNGGGSGAVNHGGGGGGGGVSGDGTSVGQQVAATGELNKLGADGKAAAALANANRPPEQAKASPT